MEEQKTAHQLTEQVKLLQKVVLVHGGKVLLLRRSGTAKSRPECWDLPGGNSEWPEQGRAGFGLHREDLVREVYEETGIELEADSVQQSNLRYFETFFDAEKQVFSVICGWKIELPRLGYSEAVRLSAEHSKYMWVLPEEVTQYDFGGKNGEFVKDIIMSSLEKNE